VILHYSEEYEANTAPAELVSVERMILHLVQPIVANHGFHRDELGGGQSI